MTASFTPTYTVAEENQGDSGATHRRIPMSTSLQYKPWGRGSQTWTVSRMEVPMDYLPEYSMTFPTSWLNLWHPLLMQLWDKESILVCGNYLILYQFPQLTIPKSSSLIRDPYHWLQLPIKFWKTCVLLCDFSKAFHLVDHQLVLRKQSDLDVPPCLVKWGTSFLLNRRHVSIPVLLNAGCPQGTRFGPIAFVAHINDLRFPDPAFGIKYVDDSSAAHSSKNPWDETSQ